MLGTSHLHLVAALAFILLPTAACSGTGDPLPGAGTPADGSPAAAPPESLTPALPHPSQPGPAMRHPDLPTVLFLGDSITAGRGLPSDQAFPAIVESELTARGLPIRVVNAGISGDTTSGGMSRLDWILGQEPDVVVVELGANDGLRGLPLHLIESNIRRIVRETLDAGPAVILTGMRIPPSYGPDYSEGFHTLYARVAAELNVAFVPFLMEGVAGVPSMNQPDGIHPTADGHRILARTILPFVEDAVRGRIAGPP